MKGGGIGGERRRHRGVAKYERWRDWGLSQKEEIEVTGGEIGGQVDFIGGEPLKSFSTYVS